MHWLERLWRTFFGGPSEPRVSPRSDASQAIRPAPPSAPSSQAIRAGAPIPRPARRGELNLDASTFLPLSPEELHRQAGLLGRAAFANVWFGRRDTIPPVDDPRTLLIDKGLVAEGLMTPEQLREIHEVGAEMERLRPTLIGIEHQATLAGQAAVEADRARRAALKEQKKKEAAERKQRRAEAVAHRRATDIAFLGRGVSSQLGQRHSAIVKLQAKGLPVLSTPADVAAALGLSIPRLRWLAFHTDVATRSHYVRFTVPKKSGGTRTLSAPHKTLGQAQQWIFSNILKRLPVQPQAHGFVPGRSVLTNAQPHVGRALLINLDLQDFFPSIGFARVRSVFHRLGYSPAVATIFALLTTESPRREVKFSGKTYYVATGPRGLPQGACTSPALANLVAARLDRRLEGLARKLGLAYTRYADDISLSGGEELKSRIGYLMATVRHIAQDEGFIIHEKKSRVLKRSAAQSVTGIIVNDKPSLRRRELRRLRALLHRAGREGLDHQNRHGRADFHAWLRGKIAYIAMIRPDLGVKFRQQLDKLTAAG